MATRYDSTAALPCQAGIGSHSSPHPVLPCLLRRIATPCCTRQRTIMCHADGGRPREEESNVVMDCARARSCSALINPAGSGGYGPLGRRRRLTRSICCVTGFDQCDRARSKVSCSIVCQRRASRRRSISVSATYQPIAPLNKALTAEAMLFEDLILKACPYRHFSCSYFICHVSHPSARY